MDAQTHLAIDAELCGQPAELRPHYCRVHMTATTRMAADDRGLVHGGFIFGMADYAAMLAVNDPHVVLGAAEARFLKPVRTGEKIVAEAQVDAAEGKKHRVTVTVSREGGEAVFKGDFTCFVLDRHVLE
ncbi:MAG: PaaI family thioesterase [Desulfobacterales bacterium]|nr:PaaI family thioesterase [Desulfobacterales bacterium]